MRRGRRRQQAVDRRLRAPLLFLSQQHHLDHFFDTLELSSARAFAETLFFTGVGKSGLVGQKLSQTLASLGFSAPPSSLPSTPSTPTSARSSPATFSSLSKKSGSSNELFTLLPCAGAKGTYLISLTSVDMMELMLKGAHKLTRDQYAGIYKLWKFLRGNDGLMFTKLSKMEVLRLFEEYEFARTRSIATEKLN